MPQGESKFIRALYYAALGEKQKALSLSRRAGALALQGMKKKKQSPLSLIGLRTGAVGSRGLTIYLSATCRYTTTSVMIRESGKSWKAGAKCMNSGWKNTG